MKRVNSAIFNLMIALVIMQVEKVCAQSNKYIDTSYTVYSAYKKAKKKYPKSTLVDTFSYKQIRQVKAMPYKIIGTRSLVLDVYSDIAVKQRKPAVILIHGGGWKSGDKSHMIPLAQQITKKGYVCVLPEYRRSPEAAYPAAILDIKSAIQYVKANFSDKIDTTKIAVLGCSSGGQMAALIGTTNAKKQFEEKNSVYNQSTDVQAIIDIDGILAFKHPESKEKDAASYWLGGTYEKCPDQWIQASALTHVSKNTPPVLFINSDHVRFHAGRDDMIKIMDSLGKKTSVKRIYNSPHTFWLFYPWFDDTVSYVVAFLDEVFKVN